MIGFAWLGVATPALAEPGDEASRTPAEMTALAAMPRDPNALALTPEVSANRMLAPRGTAALGPDGRPMNELAGVQLRLWLSRGRTAWGVGLGTAGYVTAPHGAAANAPISFTGASPTLSVGMRYRLADGSAVFADAGARALPTETMGYVTTKAGMQWKPVTSRFGLDHGALGVQFNSGYRLSLKARKDGLRIYLRGQF